MEAKKRNIEVPLVLLVETGHRMDGAQTVQSPVHIVDSLDKCCFTDTSLIGRHIDIDNSSHILLPLIGFLDPVVGGRNRLISCGQIVGLDTILLVDLHGGDPECYLTGAEEDHIQTILLLCVETVDYCRCRQCIGILRQEDQIQDLQMQGNDQDPYYAISYNSLLTCHSYLISTLLGSSSKLYTIVPLSMSACLI